MHRPDIEDNWYDSKRVWTQSRHDRDPSWYQKLGWPHVGGDEWGRMVVTVGFAWTGYISWAYRTCWKQCCHVSRQQTYELEAQRWIKPPRNVQLYLVPSQRCSCGHTFGEHDEEGDCMHLDGTAGTKGLVSLITGVSVDDIDRLGGIEDES